MKRSSQSARPRFRPMLDRLEGRALMTQAGFLDLSFGGGRGFFVNPIHAGGIFDTANPTSNRASVAVDSAGRVVVATPDSYAGLQTYAVLRLKPDGTLLDPTFGAGTGQVDLKLPAGPFISGAPSSLLIQADGKILVVGVANVSSLSTDTETIVARLNADGSADTSFGTNGVVVIDQSTIGVADPALPHAALQVDGKIVLAGTSASPITSVRTNGGVAAVRLDANGTIDSTYGTSGLTAFSDTSAGLFNTESVEWLAIGPDGRAVILSSINFGPFGIGSDFPELFRLNTNGSRDASFSQAGIQSSGLHFPNAGGLIAQPDGQFLVMGTTAATASSSAVTPLLARIKADGSLDESRLVFSSSVTLTGFALQPDGKIVVTGNGLVGPSGPGAFRLRANFTADASFGFDGLSVPAINPNTGSGIPFEGDSLAYDPVDGTVILAGSDPYQPKPGAVDPPTNFFAAKIVAAIASKTTPGDFTGDGVSDPAVYLTATGTFAIGDSSGRTAGRMVQFGTPGSGQSIPAPGDYYGTGRDDIAVYLVNQGAYAIQDPTGATAGKLIPFGTPGVGLSLPTPGDYYNTGQDDVAVYLSSGAFAIQDPTGKTAGAIIPFGMPGVGGSIPVPGDYDGSGHTELAVYVPSTATFYYRSNITGRDVAISFGMPGLGASLPMPGNYDGSGPTEVAVYVPSTGTFYYRHSYGGADVAIPFGTPDDGSLPAPGDYTGSGRTELGVYLTLTGTLAYRPTYGSMDILEQFGVPDPDAPIFRPTVPVTTVPQVPLVFLPASNTISVSGDAFGVPDASASRGFDSLALTGSKKSKPGAQAS